MTDLTHDSDWGPTADTSLQEPMRGPSPQIRPATRGTQCNRVEKLSTLRPVGPRPHGQGTTSSKQEGRFAATEYHHARLESVRAASSGNAHHVSHLEGRRHPGKRVRQRRSARSRPATTRQSPILSSTRLRSALDNGNDQTCKSVYQKIDPYRLNFSSNTHSENPHGSRGLIGCLP
jgi:hypothetical protein